jgi:hypothetical protein
MSASHGTTARAQRRRRTAVKLAFAGVAASSLALGLAAVGGAQDGDPAAPAAGEEFLDAAAAPTVTAVAPTSGPAKGGAQVVITGTGFTGATKVEFGDVGDATDFTVVSATRIVATVPDVGVSGTAGAKIIKVTNATSEVNSSGASYTYIAPTVTSITPNVSKKDVASTVTVRGTGFTAATKDDVFFNFGTPAKATKVWVVSDTELVATSPTTGTADGVVSLSVKRGNLESSTTVAAANTFVFTPGAPTVSSLSKTDNGSTGAAVGTPIDINGANMFGVTSVNFGTTVVTGSANVTVASDGTKVTVNVPARTTPGTVDVTVTSPAGTSVTNLTTSFTYLPSVAPTITAVAPTVLGKAASGGGGTLLVTGTGFTGVIKDNVKLICVATDPADNSTNVATSVLPVGDTNLIANFGGNAGKDATCSLEVAATTDTTKKATRAAAARYV